MDVQLDSESRERRIPDLTDDVAITDPFPIFAGPYSDLFRGTCDDRYVAVKIIRPVSRKHETMRRKLVRERTAWGYLDHPNVLRLLGYTQPSREFGYFGALISPWCEAGDAEELLTEHGTSLFHEHRRDLWLGTVAGVRYLHLHIPMIIHGDLKPNNILISDDGTPKICDFGLARIVFEERDSGLTTTTPHTGTHRYLAPELLELGGLPSTASDVYALGSIGLRFLFDVHPYKNTAPYMVTSDIRSGIPPASRPSDLQLDTSELWDLLDICWLPDPEERVNASWLFVNIPGPCRDPCTLREHIGIACSGICILDRRRDHATHTCLESPPISIQASETPLERRSVQLCGSTCESCGLLCMDHDQHDGAHNCMTSHKCPESCDLAGQHEEDSTLACNLPAGHAGRHMCSVTPHLCGTVCQLYGKDGCLQSCTKPMDHDEEERHLCAASIHTCGELCSLVKSDGTRLCTRPCVVDCRRDHYQHSCDRSLSCPIKCQLCNSFCAVGDHFHSLEEDAVHLCGQQHDCSRQCELPGICEIATSPQPLESTFVGRHAKFQYTKYTQEARRTPCVISIDPDKLDHDGPHVHSRDPAAFHFCEERCKHCGYYCTLPLNHRQSEHETSHGSMSHTERVIEGDEDATLELQGRKYATGDSGAPMLCSMLCKTLGRHVHLDSCRPDDEGNCVGAGVEHINRPHSTQDWVTHRLFWARSGFKDPYTQTEQADFDLCDHRCGGEEHDPDLNDGAVASHCILPLFHPPADPADALPLGHVSSDGHSYNCKNPFLIQRSFHIFFVLDRSGSMTLDDRRPLRDSPTTTRIVAAANNRFGAVISSLYAFWVARDAAIRARSSAGLRRDAYSIITFSSDASATLVNDATSTPDELLDVILDKARPGGRANYTAALKAVHKQMEDTWVTGRSPIIIFLSDGECDFLSDGGCEVADETVYDLCRTAVQLGKPLAFHSVSFGSDVYSHSLKRMATIAGEVYDAAPRDPLAPAGVTPCSFSSALDTVQLATTFLGLAESLKNPRAALSRV